jgi:hypothetical protein
MSRAHPRRRLPRFTAFALAGAAGALVAASPAWAVPGPPQNLGVTPASPMQEHNPSISWTEGTADPGESIVSYEGGFDASPTTPVATGVVTLGDGAHTFSVRAVQSDGQRSDYAQLPIVVDNGAPTITFGFSSAANAGGWRRGALTITPNCADTLSGIASCTPAFPWAGGDSATATATATATDGAGNPGSGSVVFKYDATAPAATGPDGPAGQPSEPGPAALVVAEPTFFWTPGFDATSGVRGDDGYELQFRDTTTDNEWHTIANRDDAGGVGNYSAKRDPAVWATPLPEKHQLQWRIVTFDNAGNSRSSTERFLTIDSTIPPAPQITGGPSTPIRFTSPTFTWTGSPGNTFSWDLTVPGRETPVRGPFAGPATEAMFPSLADGAYTFRVSQVTPFGQPGAQATRAFVVDTTPPVAPTITARPPFPASGIITLGWSVEPGAFSRWQIVGAGGAVVIGPSDTPLNSISIANLADGAYSFQVLQIDPAGNASATTAEPFTVTTPLAPGQSPGTNPRVQPEFLLPTQNAARLRPKAGKTLPTRRPVLRWRKGPRGTRLYNVQIFKVVKKRRGAAPTVKKVYSVFPSKRQLRAPKSKMQPGTCYVWRVWPYTGTRFTPKPLGISNFCVAKASVLKRKAAQAAARRAARRAR